MSFGKFTDFVETKVETPRVFKKIIKKHRELQNAVVELISNRYNNVRLHEVYIKECHLKLFKAISDAINWAYYEPATASVKMVEDLMHEMHDGSVAGCLDWHREYFIDHWQHKMRQSCGQSLSAVQGKNAEMAFVFLNQARIQLVSEFQAQRTYLAQLVHAINPDEDKELVLRYLTNEANLLCAAIESLRYALAVPSQMEEPDCYGSCIQEETTLLFNLTLDATNAKSNLKFDLEEAARELEERMYCIARQLFRDFEQNQSECGCTISVFYELLEQENIEASRDLMDEVFHTVLFERAVKFITQLCDQIQEFQQTLDKMGVNVEQFQDGFKDDANQFPVKWNEDAMDWVVSRMAVAQKRHDALKDLVEQEALKPCDKENIDNIEDILQNMYKKVEAAICGSSSFGKVFESVFEPVKAFGKIAVDFLEEFDKPIPAPAPPTSTTATYTLPKDVEMKVIGGGRRRCHSAQYIAPKWGRAERVDLNANVATVTKYTTEAEDLDSSTATAIDLNESVMTAIEPEDLDSSTATAIELNDSDMEDLDFSDVISMELNDSVVTAIAPEEDDFLNLSTETAIEADDCDLNESTLTAIEPETIRKCSDEKPRVLHGAIGKRKVERYHVTFHPAQLKTLTAGLEPEHTSAQITERLTACVRPDQQIQNNQTQLMQRTNAAVKTIQKDNTEVTPAVNQQTTATTPDTSVSIVDQFLVVLLIIYIALMIFYLSFKP